MRERHYVGKTKKQTLKVDIYMLSLKACFRLTYTGVHLGGGGGGGGVQGVIHPPLVDVCLPLKSQ